MSENKLKIDIRREKILTELKKYGKVSVSELSQEFGITSVTIRNDLDKLENEGLLTRVPGGAVLMARPESTDNGETVNLEEKRRIAKAVAELISDGDTLFINSGTTTREAAIALKSKERLNVVTNSIDVAGILSSMPGFRVILLGGEMNPQYGFTFGGDAQEQLSRYKADWAILAVDGVSAVGGITTYHAEEAVIDRQMIGASKQTIIAADNTKVGCAGFSRVCESFGKMCLVTDGDAEEEELGALRELGAHIVIA